MKIMKYGSLVMVEDPNRHRSRPERSPTQSYISRDTGNQKIRARVDQQGVQVGTSWWV